MSYETMVQLQDRRVPLHIPVAWAAGELHLMSDLEIREGLKDITHELARRATEREGRRDVSLFDVAQRALAERYGFHLHEAQDYRHEDDLA